MAENTCHTCEKFYRCNDRTMMNSGCDEWKSDYRLIGRTARCQWCGKESESLPGLPFFMYREDKEYDSYYCGCGGWD